MGQGTCRRSISAETDSVELTRSNSDRSISELEGSFKNNAESNTEIQGDLDPTACCL